jgi:uncharacterized protein (TIGR03435 family)
MLPRVTVGAVIVGVLDLGLAAQAPKFEVISIKKRVVPLRPPITNVINGSIFKMPEVRVLTAARVPASPVAVCWQVCFSPPGVARSAFDQLQDGTPATFDVASVRVVETPRFRAAVVRSLPGGRFEASNATVVDVIRYAFGLSRTDLIEGGPSWVRMDRYDISATSTVDPGAPSATTSDSTGVAGPVQRRVQRLLDDRFSLSVRLETRSRPGRVLTMARTDGRLGPQLQPSTLDCEATEAARIGRIISGENANAPENQPDACLGVISTNGKMRMVGHTMERLAGILSNMLSGEPVIDRTGLKGPYVIELTAAPPYVRPEFADAASQLGPPLDVALTEQLGLKLERRSIDVEVIVIDRVEHPTPN